MATAPAPTAALAPQAAALLANPELLDQQYTAWKADPGSVGADWQAFFAGFELAASRGPADPVPAPAASGTASVSRTPGRSDQQKVDGLIYAYRDAGHTVCDLDPLGMAERTPNPQLDPATYGLTDGDLDRAFASDIVYGLGTHTRLRDIIAHLKDTYCGTIGVEYQYIQDRAKRHWIRKEVEEGRNQPQLNREQQRRALMKLNQADLLEDFIHTKFLGQKRFSLEGGEALIPGLDAMIELGPELGIAEFVFGMPHRGRLNVLCNILKKRYEELFTEFEGTYDLKELTGDGDVKYHMGFSADVTTAAGKPVHLTLNHNPSHLEAVNPVVLGRVRGKQRQRGDTSERSQVVPVLLHGDAAFAGQGLVMETFQLAQLEGYKVGGCVHIIVNNQIGFTTLPADARSTRSCSDLGKMVEVPVFHVNGDDIEAVIRVCELALRYRQAFQSDVIVDLVCYRRYGHNESDEPNYTQPTMYARIAKHPRASRIYAERLTKSGVLSQAEADGLAKVMANQLQEALATVKAKPAKLTRGRFDGAWKGKTNQYSHDSVPTGVTMDRLQAIGTALSTWPAEFAVHPKIRKLAEDRGKAIASQGRIEWALGELLAFGSLLLEGTPVRLSGQDCRRGTFSQRHSYWYDITTRARYSPLDHIRDGQAKLCVYNSPLSEAAVMGFDYGYSLAEPNMLILWEGQFGDFANGAQVIIDQFLASSESKWDRFSGLVLMLPHGQEGAGPEHSSARLERFLQLCAEDNMQVAYCTTAAQHFHILRRQMHRSVRKPLILMTPKSHLRSKAAASDLAEFATGAFREVLGDAQADPAKVKRVIITSGKVAHELAERRAAEKADQIAIVRLEQLYPLHEAMLMAELKRYAKAAEWVWCQEEPQNQGAWSFIEPHLRRLLGRDLAYAGREAAASPAPGSMGLFQIEQEALIAAALGVPARKVAKGHH